MKYRPEIDGLRTLAVVPVILFHAKIPGFSGGYIGVDIFFVISGYLITRILADEMETGTYSLLRFYERRFRRILPALVVMVAVTTVAAWKVLPPLEMQWYGESLAATALFVANFYFWLRGGNYFTGLSDEYPLLHTWSLAVEEQFYIFFPILLWLIWRMGWKRVLWVIGGLSLASFLGAEVLSRINQPANFYLLPTRVWELGAGAICALLHHHTPRRERTWPALLGLVLLVGSIPLLPADIRFPSVFALPPVMGTALVILYAGPSTWTGRVLALKPMVAVGLASYSTYLWHQPLFALTHVHLDRYPGMAIMLGLSALSLVLGFVSLRVVEAPFRRRSDASSAKVVTISAGVLAAVIGLGVALHLTQGAAFRTAPAPLPADYYAWYAKPAFPGKGIDGRSCDDFCQVTEAAPGSERVLLMGDSHGQDLIAGMTDMAQARGWNLTLAINPGCSLTRIDATGGARCAGVRERLLAGIGDYDRIVLTNRLSGYPALDRAHPGVAAAVAEDYARMIRAALDTGAAVTLFEPRMIFGGYPVRAALAGELDSFRPVADFAATSAWTEALAPLRGSDRLTVISQNDVLLGLGCGDMACFDGHTPDGYPLYRDRQHLTLPTAADMVAHFAATLSEV